MNCREFVEYLLKYLSGELPADARSLADAHLEVCPDCVSFLKSYELTIKLGQKAFEGGEEKAPEDLIEVILSARPRS